MKWVLQLTALACAAVPAALAIDAAQWVLTDNAHIWRQANGEVQLMIAILLTVACVCAARTANEIKDPLE